MWVVGRYVGVGLTHTQGLDGALAKRADGLGVVLHRRLREKKKKVSKCTHPQISYFYWSFP